MLLLAACSSLAQTGNELTVYTDAVGRVDQTDRLLQLERFAVHASPGPLKEQALEFIVWEYLRKGDLTRAVTWGNDFVSSNPNNAVAIALLTEQARKPGATKPAKLLSMAGHGLEMVPQLERPLGMNGGDFNLFRRRVYAMLNSAAGYADVQMKDYVGARVYLHNAVAMEPDNAQDDYNLALADLNGDNPNRKEGYWYLARAVDLSRGTPEGAEIARFARARYIKDGGTTTDWNQFLATAAPKRERRQYEYVGVRAFGSSVAAAAALRQASP